MDFASAPAVRAVRRSSSGDGRGAGRGLPSEEGLRRSERIRQEFEYKQVVTKGRMMTGKAFNAYFLVQQDLARGVGFVAGRRVGNACLRNRAKRLLREAYRKIKPRLRATGFRVVFVARPLTPTAHLADIRNEMAWMFEKCGLMEEA
jgi:ribonuclease P protein component